MSFCAWLATLKMGPPVSSEKSQQMFPFQGLNSFRDVYLPSSFIQLMMDRFLPYLGHCGEWCGKPELKVPMSDIGTVNFLF